MQLFTLVVFNLEIFDYLETLGMAVVLFKSTQSHWVGKEYAPTTPGLTVMQQLSVGT